MSPIHESDHAEKRWSQAEWEYYELWEKVEARAQRIRRWWVIAVVSAFLILSTVPVILQQGLRWKALVASRQLADEVSSLKRQSFERQQAFRLRVLPEGALSLSVEWGPSCDSVLFHRERVLELQSQDHSRAQLGWVSSARGRELGVPGLADEFCFDPVHGSKPTPGAEDLVAFMILPVSDLSLERHASVLLSGPSAEISFE